MPVDPKALLKVTYGMFIVCSKKGDEVNGFISNSVFQVTAEPPQFAMACNKDNYTNEFIAQSGLFTVSVLKQEYDPKIIGTFGFSSGKNKDKFRDFNFEKTASGIPYLKDGNVAWFECIVRQKTDAGSHILYIGEVIAGELLDQEGQPLTYAYYHDVKKGLAPKNAPTYIDPKKLMPGKQISRTKKYVCPDWIYNHGRAEFESCMPPGTIFENSPDDWFFPVCRALELKFKERG